MADQVAEENDDEGRYGSEDDNDNRAGIIVSHWSQSLEDGGRESGAVVIKAATAAMKAAMQAATKKA
jgi:hypothetical protein